MRKCRKFAKKRWTWVRNLIFYAFRGVPWGSAVALCASRPAVRPVSSAVLPLRVVSSILLYLPAPNMSVVRQAFHLSQQKVLGEGGGEERRKRECENAENSRKNGGFRCVI